MSGDLSGLGLGLGAAFCWGLTDSLALVASRRLGSLRATAGVLLATLGAIATLMVVTATPLPSDLPAEATALAAGCISACAYLAFFTALRHGPITVVSPVVSLYGSLTVVLSIVLLGESLHAGQGLGVLTAATGVGLASVTLERGWRQTRLAGAGAAYALVALVAFAFAVVVISGPVRTIGWLPALLLTRVSNTAIVWLVLAVARSGRLPVGGSVDRRSVDARSIATVLVAAALDLGGFVSFSLGLRVAPTWLVGLASSFGPVVAVAVGVTILRERPRALQWAGLGLVAVSVVLIGLG